MKKTIPLWIGILTGLFMFGEFYFNVEPVRQVKAWFLDYALILGSAAFVLGGISVLQVNYPKIQRRETDWPYKVLLLGSAFAMGLSGIAWHQLFSDEAPYESPYRVSERGPSDPNVFIEATNSDFDVKIGASITSIRQGTTRAYSLPSGMHKILLHRNVAGYRAQQFTVSIAQSLAGATDITEKAEPNKGEQKEIAIGLRSQDMVIISGAVPMEWGVRGRVYVWLYDHVFAPCNATMFALLAFFIASAAFRAFRARNTEAGLLLFSAIIILLGRAPIGGFISSNLPDLADWIVNVPNNAGRRAIMIGAALGMIATSLRIILGMERSHLGTDS